MNAESNTKPDGSKVYLNGLGLGSIAAAMYLIQKADFNPSDIHIFEQKGDNDLVGGSCDASEMIVNDQPAYSMQGSRMFEFKNDRKPAEFEFWKTGTFHFCVQDPNIEDLVEKSEMRSPRWSTPRARQVGQCRRRRVLSPAVDVRVRPERMRDR